MDGWLATLGRNHFPPCYMYTCSRSIAHALIGRMEALWGSDWISPHAGLEPASPIIQSQKQSQSWKSWLYCCWFENEYSLSFTGLPEFLVDSVLCTGWPVFVRMCPHCLNNPVVPFGICTSFYFSLLLSYYFCIKLIFILRLPCPFIRCTLCKKWIDSRVWEWKLWLRTKDKQKIRYKYNFIFKQFYVILKHIHRKK